MAGFCVCIPARDEADQIGTLIDALACQTVVGPVRIALCVNNSDDGTTAAALRAAARAEGRIDLSIDERLFEPALAHAGTARRIAMDLGADLLNGDDGILLSTDADCRPPENWVEANLAACGADGIVGGRIVLDESAPIADGIRAFRARFDHYWDRVRAIEDAIDPIVWDLPPRHGDHTGASLALSVGLYRRADGVPLLPTGEDRALVAAAIAVGGRLSHPLSVWTRASARTVGRAAGGMAADMAEWVAREGGAEVPQLPSFEQWRERATWRHAIRARGGDTEVIQAERSLPPMPCDMPLPDLAA